MLHGSSHHTVWAGLGCVGTLWGMTDADRSHLGRANAVQAAVQAMVKFCHVPAVYTSACTSLRYLTSGHSMCNKSNLLCTCSLDTNLVGIAHASPPGVNRTAAANARVLHAVVALLAGTVPQDSTPASTADGHATDTKSGEHKHDDSGGDDDGDGDAKQDPGQGAVDVSGTANDPTAMRESCGVITLVCLHEGEQCHPRWWALTPRRIVL